MQFINKFNKEICVCVCVIDINGKYSWVIPLKYKNGVTIVSSSQKILDDSKRKPN